MLPPKQDSLFLKVENKTPWLRSKLESKSSLNMGWFTTTSRSPLPETQLKVMS
jgi:hypothetical protein